jgi:hypothetical protein
MERTKRLNILFWLAIIAVLLGIFGIVLSYFLIKLLHPLIGYLALNLGGLLAFSAAYTLLSEFLLRRDFAKEMSNSIDEKLESVKLHESIVRSGLSEIFESFTDEILLQRLMDAGKVKMMVLRSNSFFRKNNRILKEKISKGLKLEILLPNTRNPELMALLAKKFTDNNHDPHDLANSIADCVNNWLRSRIWDGLAADAKTRLIIYLGDNYPVYSAYVFDEKELWYIPYQHRKDWQPIPVFVFKDNIQDLELFKDIDDSFKEQAYNLQEPLTAYDHGG